MMLINTAKTWFVVLVLMADAAMPLYASITRTIEISARGTATLRSCETLGRMAACTNAEGRVFRLSYDAQGRLLAATNAAGERFFRNFYDRVGHQKSAKPEAEPTGDRDFEAVRMHGARSGIPRRSGTCNLTNKVDAASRRTEFHYDAVNRHVETLYADGSWERFGYDAAGNLTAASNAASRLAFGYDAMNRLTGSVTRVSSFEFQVSRSQPSSVTRMGYDLVWFGQVVCLVTTLGAITPPAGVSCFVVAGMSPGARSAQVLRGAMRFLPAYAAVYALLSLFPQAMVGWRAGMVR